MVALNHAGGVVRAGNARRVVRVGEARTALELAELIRPLAKKVRRGKKMKVLEVATLDKAAHRLAPSDAIAAEIVNHGYEYPPGPGRLSPMAVCHSRDCGRGLRAFPASYTQGTGRRRRCGDCHEQDILLDRIRLAGWEASHVNPPEAEGTDGTAATAAELEREAMAGMAGSTGEAIARVKDLGEMVMGWTDQGEPVRPVVEELRLPPESREALKRQIDRYLAGQTTRTIHPFRG